MKVNGADGVIMSAVSPDEGSFNVWPGGIAVIPGTETRLILTEHANSGFPGQTADGLRVICLNADMTSVLWTTHLYDASTASANQVQVSYHHNPILLDDGDLLVGATICVAGNCSSSAVKRILLAKLSVVGGAVRWAREIVGGGVDRDGAVYQLDNGNLSTVGHSNSPYGAQDDRYTMVQLEIDVSDGSIVSQRVLDSFGYLGVSGYAAEINDNGMFLAGKAKKTDTDGNVALMGQLLWSDIDTVPVADDVFASFGGFSSVTSSLQSPDSEPGIDLFVPNDTVLSSMSVGTNIVPISISPVVDLLF